MKNFLFRILFVIIALVGGTTELFADEVTKHKVEFSINGVIDATNTIDVTEGDFIKFPYSPSIYGYDFIGWAKSSIAGTQDAAPEVVDVSQEKMRTEDIMYYAVFAEIANYKDKQQLTNVNLPKDGDRIVALIETNGKYYGLYHEATPDGFINSFILEKNFTVADIVADPKRSWVITSAGNYKWYIGDNALGYLYNNEDTDNFSLSQEPKTSFSIDCEFKDFKMQNGSRWFSFRNDEKVDENNRLKFHGGGNSIRKIDGIFTFHLYRLIANHSSYCTTLPSSSITFAATDGQDYYATYCNYNAVAFPKTLSDGRKISVEAVSVVNGIIDKKDIAAVFSCVKDNKVIVPANTGVLLHVEGATEAPTVPYSIFTEEVPGQMEELKSFNMLIPCLTTGMCPSAEGDNKYYRLAYGDYSAKTNLGFWWGHEGGTNDFNVKAGGAVLCVPNSAGSNIRGFGFNDPGTLTIVGCRADENNTNIIYNFRGQRIGSQKKGVIIAKGRKVIR